MDKINFVLAPKVDWSEYSLNGELQTEIVEKANTSNWNYINLTSDTAILEHDEFGETLYFEFVNDLVSSCAVNSVTEGSSEFLEFLKLLHTKYGLNEA